MDLKFNRKIGALVLVAAIILGSAIGISKGGATPEPRPEPGASAVSNLVDDRAGVLNSDAIAAVENVRENTRGTLLVQTVLTTGGRDVYDYTLATAESLASDGRLSDSTGMLLVLAVEEMDYAFVYGGDLWELDYAYEDLLYQYLEPDFAKGNFSAAVEEFCDELDDTVEDASYYEDEGEDAFISLVFIVIVLVILFSRVRSRVRYRVFNPFPFFFFGGGRPPMPPRGYTHPRNYNPPRSSGFSGSSRSGFSGSSGFSGGSRGGFSGGSRGGFSGGSRGGGFSGGKR